MAYRDYCSNSSSDSYLWRGDQLSTGRKRLIRAGAGFTIVELLIVIVVIAILAAITVVAYTGISDRAQASKRLASVDAWEKAIRIYESTHGSYPVPSGSDEASACLGSDFSARDGFPLGGYILFNGSSIGYTEVPELNTMLKEYINIPNTEFPTVKINVSGMTIQQRGLAYYASNKLNINGGEVSLVYYISSDQNCGRGMKSYDPANKFGICKVYIRQPQSSAL